jgi:glycosyltransferase involved in cell wall biosynthesis
MRLYYWIHHTGCYGRNTGVQRVVRNLAIELGRSGHESIPVRWSHELEAIVRADERWVDGLGRFDGPVLPRPEEEGVPLHLTAVDAGRLEGSWLVVPEVPHVGNEAPLPAVVFDYAQFVGLRIGVVFYDLVPLRQSGYDHVAPQHQRYARALTAADVVGAISEHAAGDLRDWWSEKGYEPGAVPPVVPVPLAAEIVGVPRVVERDEPALPIRFTALGTVEPRKNQVEVMRAFSRLRARRPDVEMYLEIVGGIHEAVAREVEEIAGRDDQIRLHDYVSDEAARRFVAASHATIFMSLYEGFGLPIAESLWLGTPCLCSDHGAMAELATDGGCLMVPAVDSTAIETALERLVDDGELRRRLREEAQTRRLRSWGEYAEDLVATLERTPLLRELVLVEGSRGPVQDVDVPDAARVRRLHWRPESCGLLPGAREAPESPQIGDGQLKDLPALLRAADFEGPDELVRCIESARGLGLRPVLLANRETPSEAASSVDVAIFEDAEERDAALAKALRELPRTVGVRSRFESGTGADVGRAIRAHGSRLSVARVPRPPTRVFYWAGLTAEQPFNTGIQRVTRMLGAALQRQGVEVVPVGWDPVRRRMRVIPASGLENLERWSGPRQPTLRDLPEDLAGEWLLLPEITVPVVPPGSNVAMLASSLGMRCAAVFYDLIPDKMPELYPPEAVENIRAFWRTFGSVDLALPISWSAAADLHRWLATEGLAAPDIVPCVLAGDSGAVPRTTVPPEVPADEKPLRLLAVGTWEPRKNYPRLLRALAKAQTRAKRPIRLTMVGRRGGYDDLDLEIERLASSAAVVVHDHVEDERLHELYENASATVFASWEEGFGLPVVESLWHGRPCLCHAGSSMAELVPGGGVLGIDMLDERQIEDAMVSIADDGDLLARLGEEAVERPIRTWDEYAEDVVRALASVGSPPGWPLTSVTERRPLLTCAITTYNRAGWLQHSLPRLLDLARPWRDVVEVVVCDNASTDNTPNVVRQLREKSSFVCVRNEQNIGMLGNLGATARASTGAFVWLLGDDDLLIDGALENVIEGLARHPDVEMAYMNYAYTVFDDPAQLDDARRLVSNAAPIANGGSNRYVRELREVAPLNENLFTAIYTCAFRRDHALRAYQLDTRGAPFTSLATCVPSSVYALAALQNRPAWWVGEPAVVVNMNVSWLRWVLLWHLERMPDLFEEAELHGVPGDLLDRYRLQHLVEAEKWVRAAYFEAEDTIREHFSLGRLLERSKHLPEFRERHLEGVRRVYSEAWEAGRVVDPVPPDALFERYGL